MIGQQLGPYTIEAELGSGGMGTVYRAQGPDGVVALKVLHPHLLASAEARERFRREAEIGRRVVHANVVRALDLGSVVVHGVTHHYLVMEHVEGQTLRALLAELGRVPEELCRHVGRAVARGLAAIHAAGVAHRDLKPANVLITADHVVKVMDLGVARLLDEAIRLTQTGAFLGSVMYAAPEQLRGVPSGPAADFYSLGLVLFELATGRHPFAADPSGDVLSKRLQTVPRPVGELNPQLSPFFEEVCKALLEIDPEKRLSFLPEDEDSTWWRARARAIRLDTRQPLRRIHVPRETAVYGRDRELARLRELYDRAAAGSGQVVLIEGEAGIGKTRLVDEFIARLRRTGEELNFLFGSYPPGGAATAAGAFTTAYGDHFGREDLEETLRRHLKSTPPLVPAFAALLRREPTPRGEEALTKDSLQTVFVHATRDLAAERPTVVMIDDLHFSPDDGLALFAALALAVPGHRVLLVGTTRHGLSEEWVAGLERAEHASRIRLARLGASDLVKLLRDAFASDRMANELGVLIAQKSDGNPYFVFELIRGLAEGRFITRREDGRWDTTGKVERIEIPSSVLDLIEARLSALAEDDRELLEVAACCGFEFDPSLVAAALGQEVVPVLKRFGRIERTHRLIRSAGSRYRFDHHQVQEVLYDRLFAQLRQHYHAAVAEVLEARTEKIDAAVAIQLCKHFFEGGSAARALPHVDAALTALEDAFENERMIRLADRALATSELEGSPRLDLLLRKARRLELMGRPSEELETLEAARAVADSLADAASEALALAELGWHHMQQSRHEEALDLLQRAVDRAADAGDRRIEAKAYGGLGRLFWRMGRMEDSRKFSTRHLEFSREIGHRQGEALGESNLGILALEDNRLDDARARFDRHLELARELGDRRNEAGALGNLGIVSWRQGRYDQSRAYFEQGLRLAREVGHRRGEAQALGHLGNVASSQGRREEALDHMQRFLALARETGDLRNEAHALANLGTISLTLGLASDALDYAQRYAALSDELGLQQGQVIAPYNEGEVWAMLGRSDRARACFETARARAAEHGIHMIDLHLLWAVGELEARAGDAAGAERRLSEAVDQARELGAASVLACLLYALGRVLADQGREDQARERLEEAHRLGRETGTPGPLVRAAGRLALLPGGDPERALGAHEEFGDRLDHDEALDSRFLLWRATGQPEHLVASHHLLMHLLQHAPEECRQSVVTGVPLHRAIARAWEERDG